MSELNYHDNISLLLHQIIKEKLLSNPQEVIQKAKSNLKNWESKYPTKPGWMREWQALLDKDINEVIAVLENVDEHSIFLRSSSPFAGLISPQQRWTILREQRKS